MAVNKVVYAATVLLDLTEDTVTSAAMRQGFTAHNKAGEVVTGSIEEKNSASLTITDGTFSSANGSAVWNVSGGTAEISGGALSASNNKVIPSHDKETIEAIKSVKWNTAHFTDGETKICGILMSPR